MRILVMIKRVCEPESRFDLKDGRAVLQQGARFRMGLYSEHALETGLALAEAVGGRVTALTMGPQAAGEILTRAGGMGAARCVHMLCDEDAAHQPFAVAAAASAWALEQGFDLILTGVMSEDAMHGALGPAMAETMGLALTTSATQVSPGNEAGRLSLVRELAGGRRQEVDLPLPAVVTVQSSQNPPRYPSLSKLLAAKRNPPETVSPAPAPPLAAEARFLEAMVPRPSRQAVMLAGGTEEKAAALLEALKERALL